MTSITLLQKGLAGGLGWGCRGDQEVNKTWRKKNGTRPAGQQPPEPSRPPTESASPMQVPSSTTKTKETHKPMRAVTMERPVSPGKLGSAQRGS